MKNLSSRTISAVIAALIFIATIYFGQEKGAYILCLLVVVRASFEVARMFFSENYPKFVKRLFVCMSTGLFLLITQNQFGRTSTVPLILSFVLVTSFAVIFHRSFKDLDQILTFVAKNCLGLVYTCFLPATVAWTIQTDNGLDWFFCLLCVVFAGDIGAYIFGMTLGKTKIAPLLSPKKTIEGSAGGLLFSVLAALCFKFLLTDTPLYLLCICGLLGGIFGQIGDFFESLIKRVSGVKDSGSIMPGHGGVLDRLDGVLFSAPLFYIMATYFSF